MEGKNFIAGKWVSPKKGQTTDVHNPSNGDIIGKLAHSSSEDMEDAILAADQALKGPWGELTATERGKYLKKMAGLIRENAERLATLEAQDVGKPLKQAKSDAEVCARYFEFYGEAADKVLGTTIPFQKGYTVMTVREPHGVTGHIVPWNYPMQIMARSVAAALAMGNTCVVKPAEDASMSALLVADLVRQAGFPDGVFNIVTGAGSEIGKTLTTHPLVRHISFTGSTETGTTVQKAGAENTIPVTLELGGKSPQLVFADADLDKALPFLVNASIQNAGQTCSAGSRLIVEASIYDEVARKMASKFSALTIGDAESDPDVGPVINKKQYERILEVIKKAKSDGIKVVAEAVLDKSKTSNDFFIPPIIFGDVDPEHSLAQEEIFGPVLVMIKVKDEAEAIKVANGTKYGLVAGVWTKDGSRAMRLAKKIEAGQVFINNFGAAGGAELPFGGVKSSGHGREKGLEALNGFSVVKTIAIKHD